MMRFSLRTKLVLSFLLVTLVIGAAGLFILSALNGVERQYEDSAMRYQKAHAVVEELHGIAFRQTAAVRGYLLAKDFARLQEYEAAGRDLDARIDELLSLEPDQADRDQAAKLRELNQQYDASVRKVFALVQEGKLEDAMALNNTEAVHLAREMTETTESLAEAYDKKAGDAEAAIHTLAAQARLYGEVALGAGFVLAVAISLWLARGISVPIRLVAVAANQLASGDLRVEPLKEKGRDEVAELSRAVNGMIRALRSLVGGVQASTQTVAGASADLTQVADQASRASEQAVSAVSTVAAGANQQAGMVAEVTQSMRQLEQTGAQLSSGAAQTSAEVQWAVDALTQMVRDIRSLTDDAKRVAEASLQAADVARSGSEIVARTETGMERIRKTTSETAGSIRELERLSSRVGEITGVISEIADQTNLLALNAAIEAARAGDAGRGFAVVAEEVRKLAERSSRSAREIAGLIASIQEGTARAVVTMGAGIDEVEGGSKLAQQAGAALGEIFTVVDRTVGEILGMASSAAAMLTMADGVSRSFDSISAVTEETTAAAEEMAAAAEQVLLAVDGIARVSQETAAVAQEVSASTEEVTASADQVASAANGLQSIAGQLQVQVSAFKL